ncbi:hypothetical protein S245_025568, partial [Arachis hypogaea]
YDQFGISRKGPKTLQMNIVELLEGGKFWFSESPSVPGSMSWGSEVPCITTWAVSLLFCISFYTSIQLYETDVAVKLVENREQLNSS